MCYVCPKCSTRIYYMNDFEAQFISPKQMADSERCVFYILLAQCITILIFGIVTLSFSLTLRKDSEKWIGIVVFVICVLLQFMLIPNILVRFTHRFFIRKRVNRRPSAMNAYMIASGRYLQDIMENTSIEKIMMMK